jgi:REP element-mobilizing transposase RayT
MPSPPPLQPGCYYHIFNRGNNRENIFIEERNYNFFINLYARHIEPVADTYAFCLMRNHFHFLIRTKEEEETLKVSKTFRVSADASHAFSNLFNAYAKAINKAYDRTGSLFERPFGRVLIDSNAHFTWLIVYIHQNPQKHGFVGDFRPWPYSSFRALISTHPTLLKRQVVMEWFGGREGFLRLHQDLSLGSEFDKLASIDPD